MYFFYHKCNKFAKYLKYEIIGCAIIPIYLNYARHKMNAVHAERWWKVANCCNRLQWVDGVCFGPAVRNGIGYGTVLTHTRIFFNLSILLLFLVALLFLTIIHKNYSRKLIMTIILFIKIIHDNYSWQLLIKIIHDNYSWKLFIKIVH